MISKDELGQPPRKSPAEECAFEDHSDVSFSNAQEEETGNRTSMTFGVATRTYLGKQAKWI